MLGADLDHVLARTRDLWREMSDAQIFITGGTGFFGCWLLETFTRACDELGLGARATVLTRSPEAFRDKAPHLAGHPAVRLWSGDVCAFDFPPGRFTHVIHAATEASAALIREDPLRMLTVIVDGTRRTLEFAAASGARKFLLASSGAVYGPQPPELTHVTESCNAAPDPANPSSAYGEGKRAAELLCAIYARTGGLEVKIARGFAFVGPYLPLDMHFAVANFIADRLRGGPVVVRGDGTPFRSYLYAADLAVWLWTILERGANNRAYNVGSEEAVSIRELAECVAALEPTVQVRVMVTPSGRSPERYVPSTARARAELGLEQWISLEEGIRRTAAWWAARRCG